MDKTERNGKQRIRGPTLLKETRNSIQLVELVYLKRIYVVEKKLLTLWLTSFNATSYTYTHTEGGGEYEI